MKTTIEFTATASNPVTLKTHCLVLPLSTPGELSETAKAIDEATGGLISRVIKKADLAANIGETLLLVEPEGLQAQRLLLVNTGEDPLNEQSATKFANTIGKALAGFPISTSALILDGVNVENRDSEWLAKHLARVIVASSYRFDQFLSKKDKQAKTKPQLKKITLVTTERKQTKTVQQAALTGVAIAAGVNTARQLGDLPGNVCTPSYLANQAKALAKKHSNISCAILGEKEMRSLGMNSLLSVSAGSAEPAKLIVLQYQGGSKSQKPVALVGKGVTFDSGGISLKPGAGMDEMKYDMCGAASVLGTLTALAELAPAINVVGVIPTVENMPSSTATKPGDIVTSLSGQTIEILNTDAEGRLILCDALTYVEKFKPATVIDIATLTGACVVALGSHASGLFSNQDELAEALLCAGASADDRAWRLPIWPEYDQQLKSNFADMANIGGPKAGSVTAACFLARFTRDYHWAHLDIAGTAWNNGSDKGATGRPVPLLVEYLLTKASSKGNS